jgi:hypothetical protein
MDNIEPKTLIAHCGIYCGGCGMYRGRIIARIADDLKKLTEAHRYPEWVPKFGGIDFDFAEFQKGLEYFTRESSGCYCQEPCSQGGGMPRCNIRECAQKREVGICFECSDYPCELFSQFLTNHPEIASERERFQELGPEEWVNAQMRKAERGYCHGTGKYYAEPKPE